MPLTPPTPRKRAEPTIALINIVFLMLIFFMVAGTLAPPQDGRVKLVNTADLEGRSPPDAAVLLQDGTLAYRGLPASVAEIVARDAKVRIVPDRAVPARRLLEVARQFTDAGARGVWIVTERGIR